MPVTITWSMTKNGSNITNVDHGFVEVDGYTSAKEIFIHHDGSNSLENCAFYFAEKPSGYTGDFTAASDFAEILGWGDDNTASGFGGIQINMDARSHYVDNIAWSMHESQKSSLDGYKVTVRTGTGDSSTNTIILSKNMNKYMSSHGIIPSDNTLSPALDDLYEHSIIVTNSAGITLTNISVLVVIDTATLIAASQMHSNGSARFIDQEDNDLAYWIEGPVNNSATKYWFKIPSISPGATDIMMRFGGSADFSSYEDGYNTFLFFDDFDGPTHSQWTTVTGTPSYTSSVLTLDAGEGMFANGFILPDDSVIETMANPLSTSNQGGAVRAATSTGSGFVGDGGANITDILWYFGTLYGETNSGETNMGAYTTGMKKYAIKHRINGADSSQFIYNDGTASTTRTGTQSGVLKPVMYSATLSSSWDWIRVYKNIDNKITTSVSSDVTPAAFISPSFQLRMKIPSNEGVYGRRQFSQFLKYTYTP
jgi:hypothetical protein